MKKYRSVLCALLALILVFSLCACSRSAGGEGGEVPIKPDETGRETVDSMDETPEETPGETDAESVPSDLPEDRSGLVILNWEEYVTRPHEIQEGTVLNYAGYDVPSQLPWNCMGEGWLADNIYEGLLYMYMNDPGDIRGCIAESWTHSDDYLTWTFQIRTGIGFTDGTACDTPAIAKSWDFYKEASPASFTNLNITSWEAVSDRALVITLSAPCAWLEAALTQLYIVSPTALALHGLTDNGAAIGTGPYYIESYTSGGSIILKANPGYTLMEKMPCIETVNFKILGWQRDPLDALINGDVDGARIIGLENNYFINSHYANSYQYLQEKGYDGNLVACLGGGNPMWFNAKKVEAFQTYEVRKAMCRFIDFSAINNELYDGMGMVQDSLWTKGSSGYVQTDQFYYDPDAGLELLASVGLVPSDIQFEAICYDFNEDIFYAVQEELKKATVEMDIDLIGPESSFTFLMRNVPISFGSVGYSNSVPYMPWNYILKPDALIKQCWQDIYNPELYQKMLDEYDAMITAVTWDKMLTHCRQLTTYEQADFGAIGGVQAPVFVALSRDFKNGIYFSEQHDIQLYYLYQ